MIGKVPKAGRGFKGLVTYLLNGARDKTKPMQRVAWAASRNLISDRPEHAPMLMRATAAKNSRVKSPVYHYVISWHKNEAPTDELMEMVADTTCEDMGLEEYQRVYIAHTDTDHRHVHIVVNRVHPETGKAWNRRQDWVVIEQSLKRQADSHGLEFVPGRHNTPEKMAKAPRRSRDGAYQRSKRQGRGEPRQVFTIERIAAERERLAPIFEAAENWQDLQMRLAEHDLHLEAKGQGLVIADETGEMKLSSLGKDIRMVKLEKRFGLSWASYERSRVPEPEAVQPDKGLIEEREARQDAFEALLAKLGEADIAVSLYRGGLINRRQLERALAERTRASEAVSEHTGMRDQIEKDIANALAREHSPKSANQPDPSKVPSRSRRRRQRDRER